ncbi:MAG TPA: MGMT family protein [Chloroflexia bacterium]|nr:MGMT family protein [Chloroflexia bacterium]
MSEFNDKVYQIVRSIPRGRVMTYGQVAAILGVPRAARAVGWALHWVDENLDVPCQRVVNRFGGLASGYGWGGQVAHKADLVAEEVEVSDDFTVNLDKYQWWPSPEDLPDLQLSIFTREELDRKLPESKEQLSLQGRRKKRNE